ncbi:MULTISPECIES: transposase [Mycolicibacterium]|uniref:transposase n=1 Tax=Mycolicibacterium TaxID=1866885 RepID=UPI0009E8C649|nr:transposase [Actinomycetota bacterium]RUP27229.1 MAG: hypothetical protein EKK51_27655 [Mycolicibacterium sp.]
MTDLRERGLGCPLLVVFDGAKGLIAAIEQIYPKALRQRCLIHRLTPSAWSGRYSTEPRPIGAG